MAGLKLLRLAAAVMGGRKPIVFNGKFSGGTAGWTANIATLASVAGGQTGKCLLVTNTTDGTGRASQQLMVPAGIYTLELYEKNGDTTGYVTVSYAEGGFDLLNATVNNANWGQYTVNFNAANANFWLNLFIATPATGFRVYYDEVKVTRITHFVDDFERANGAPGTSPSTLVWAVTGTTIPAIASNRLTITPGGGAGYAYIDMPTTPQEITGDVTWTGGAGSGDGVSVFVSSKNQASRLDDMVHLGFSTTTWFLQTRAEAGEFENIGGGNLNEALVQGETYHMGMRIFGNTVTVLFPDGTRQVFTDARIGANKGPYLVYELTNSDAGKWCPRFESVQALL